MWPHLRHIVCASFLQVGYYKVLCLKTYQVSDGHIFRGRATVGSTWVQQLKSFSFLIQVGFNFEDLQITIFNKNGTFFVCLKLTWNFSCLSAPSLPANSAPILSCCTSSSSCSQCWRSFCTSETSPKEERDVYSSKVARCSLTIHSSRSTCRSWSSRSRSLASFTCSSCLIISRRILIFSTASSRSDSSSLYLFCWSVRWWLSSAICCSNWSALKEYLKYINLIQTLNLSSPV